MEQGIRSLDVINVEKIINRLWCGSISVYILPVKHDSEFYYEGTGRPYPRVLKADSNHLVLIAWSTNLTTDSDLDMTKNLPKSVFVFFSKVFLILKTIQLAKVIFRLRC